MIPDADAAGHAAVPAGVVSSPTARREPMRWGSASGSSRSTARSTSAASSTSPASRFPAGFVRVRRSRKSSRRSSTGAAGSSWREWLAARENPLTARVMVNRVWLHLFGRGLVPTPDNFGAAGQAPEPSRAARHAGSFVHGSGLVGQAADPPDRAQPGLSARLDARRQEFRGRP